ncbi:MAG TPA: LicD family protein [Tissierellaceae bacterium]|nr:LicD family protein [Tissierellaceae bacterium]
MKNSIDEETLRKVQLIQLEILVEFDRICKINNLQYQLFSGTLIGAIRHKGFIPWDDDIDVAMTRKDYERFLNICNDYLGSDYFLQNYDTDPNFHRQFSRIRKNNTKYIQYSYENIDIHHGIFIDIFPMDDVIPDNILEKLRDKTLLAMFHINRLRNLGVNSEANIIKKIAGKVIEGSNSIIKKSTFDRRKTKIMKAFQEKDTDYINHLTNTTTPERFKRFLIKKEDFYDTIEWEFEGYKFPIPRNYHQYLTNIYGDYMELPPEEERKPHHGIIEIETN